MSAAAIQGFSLESLAPLSGSLVLLLGAKIWVVTRAGTPILCTPLCGVQIALLFWLVATTFLSSAPAASAIAIFSAIVLPVAFLASSLDNAQKSLVSLPTMLATAVFLLVGHMLFGYFIQNDPAASSTFVQRNSLAAFASLASFVLLNAAQGELRSRTHRALLLVAVFLGWFTIFFSTSRGAIGALLTGLFVLALMVPSEQRVRLLKQSLVLVAAAFFMANFLLEQRVSASIISLAPSQITEGVHEGLPNERLAIAFQELGLRFQAGDDSAFYESKRAAVSERWLIWRAAVETAKAAPWHGFGPGTFRFIYPAFADSNDTSAGNYAHNDYLQIFIETGWLGLVLYVVLVCLVLGQSLQAIRSKKHGLESACLGAGILAFLAHAFFSYSFFVPANALLFALLLSRFDALTAPKAYRFDLGAHFRPRILAVVLVALVAIPIVSLSLNVGMSRYYERGVAALATGDLEAAQNDLLTAKTLQNSDLVEIAFGLLYAGAARVTKEPSVKAVLIDRARDALNRAEKMNPYNAAIALGRLEVEIVDPALSFDERLERSQRVYEAGIYLNPRYLPLRTRAAQWLIDKNVNQARAIVEEGTKHPIADGPGLLDYLSLLAELRKLTNDQRGASALEAALRSVKSWR
ncbi:MAG: O-antigen ligase family protein [Pseudomonadota bacterium]